MTLEDYFRLNGMENVIQIEKILYVVIIPAVMLDVVLKDNLKDGSDEFAHERCCSS